MLELVIPERNDEWDSIKKEFVSCKGATLRLEHSLISISKWESKWHIPFLKNEELNEEQLIDYVKCMTITQSVPDEVYDHLTNDNLLAIKDYISNPMTATWFNDRTPGGGRGPMNNQVVTSELIYYWMIAQNIPVEFEKWHLNRLMTLIKVCSYETEKANGGKKMSRKEILNSNYNLNKQRRQMLHTKG